MDYFWIKEDRRYLNTPTILGLDQIIARRSTMDPDKADRILDVNVAYAKSESPLDYPDVLNQQIFLINDKLKKVFSIYDKRIKYKTFCILNNLCYEYNTYYAPILEKVDCVAVESVISPDKNYIKNLILKDKKIGNRSIFKVDGLTDVVILRLDVLESILRRGKPAFDIVKISTAYCE